MRSVLLFVMSLPPVPDGMVPADMWRLERALRDAFVAQVTGERTLAVQVDREMALPVTDLSVSVVWRTAKDDSGRNHLVSQSEEGVTVDTNATAIERLEGVATISAPTKLHTTILTCGSTLVCHGSTTRVRYPGNVDDVRFLTVGGNRLEGAAWKRDGDFLDVTVAGALYQAAYVEVLERSERSFNVTAGLEPRHDIPVDVALPRFVTPDGGTFDMATREEEVRAVARVVDGTKVILPPHPSYGLCVTRIDAVAKVAHVRCPTAISILQPHQLEKNGVHVTIKKNHVDVRVDKGELFPRPPAVSERLEPVRAFIDGYRQLRKLPGSWVRANAAHYVFWGTPTSINVNVGTHYFDVDLPLP